MQFHKVISQSAQSGIFINNLQYINFLMLTLCVFTSNIANCQVLIIENNKSIQIATKGKIIKKHIDHFAMGCTASKSEKWIAIYGLPINIDIDYPQTTKLTILQINKKTAKIKFKNTFGSGLYSVYFDQMENLHLSDRFQSLEINTQTMKVIVSDFLSDAETINEQNSNCKIVKSK